MKNLCKTIISLLFILAYSADAQFDRKQGFFWGVGFGLFDTGIADNFDQSVQFKAVDLHLGYQAYSFLGVDIRYGLAPEAETFGGPIDPETGLETTIESTLDDYTSIFYRAELRNDIAKIYLLLGQTTINVTNDFANGTSTTGDVSGTSWGIGGAIWLNKRWDFTLEFKQLIDDGVDEFTLTSGNLEYRF